MTSPLGIVNEKDPLRDQDKAVKEIFQSMAKLLHGLPREKVIDVGANLIITAIRQEYATRKEAENKAREVMTKIMAILIEHHYYPSGARKNVFAFTQNIDVNEILRMKRM